MTSAMLAQMVERMLKQLLKQPSFIIYGHYDDGSEYSHMCPELTLLYKSHFSTVMQKCLFDQSRKTDCVFLF